PVRWDTLFAITPLWTSAWDLGVAAADTEHELAALADADWTVHSRDVADAQVVRLLASLAGFEPRIAHRADSLELVQDLIIAGLGVGLLPADGRPAGGVRRPTH